MRKNIPLFLLIAFIIISCSDNGDPVSQTGNYKPTAKFKVTPSVGDTGVTFSFDPSGSFDTEDNYIQLEVRWDIGADGTWESDFTTNKTFSKKFDKKGAYSVRLEIRDTQGAVNRAEKTLWITGPEDQGKPFAGVPYVDYNGMRYKTVLIGNQVWMASDLNVGNSIPLKNEQQNNGLIEKYLNGGQALYQWDEAMDYSTNEGTRGICPEGWHIPSRGDFEELTNYLADNDIFLQESGFNVGQSGVRNPAGFLEGENEYSYYWSSGEMFPGLAGVMKVTTGDVEFSLTVADKKFGCSLRAVMD